MPAVAALSPVIVALAAALLIFAAYFLFRPVLVALAHMIPVLGNTLADVIDGVIGYAYGWAKIYAEVALAEAVGVIATPLHWIATLFDALAAGQYEAYLVLVHLRFTVIPRMINAALTQAATWDAGVQRYAAGLYTQAVAYTRAATGALQSWAQSALAAQSAYTGTLFGQSVTYTGQVAANGQAFSSALFTQAVAYAAAGQAQQSAYAQTLFNQSIAYTGAQVTDLEGWVEGRLSALQDWTGSLAGTLEGQIASSFTQAVSIAKAEAGTVEADLTKIKTECLDNLCGNLGGLASLLGLLSSVWDAAMLAELLGEVIHDPHGAARQIDAVVGAPARTVAGIVLGQVR